MIDDDLDLLAGFRSEVPAPDAETAQRIYGLATTRRPRWQVLLPGRLSRRPRLAVAALVAANTSRSHNCPSKRIAGKRVKPSFLKRCTRPPS